MRFCNAQERECVETAELWLRCFLGGVVWTLLFLAIPNTFAQKIEIPKPERLSHVEGYVVNAEGHPAIDVEVTLKQDEKVAYRTRTNKSGEFQFDHVSGTYLFQVARSKDAPAAREIVVTDEIVTALERKRLFVILGPGACMDACSSVLTNKKDFDRAIREKNRH
jgi:hypothetical protein